MIWGVTLEMTLNQNWNKTVVKLRRPVANAEHPVELRYHWESAREVGRRR